VPSRRHLAACPDPLSHALPGSLPRPTRRGDLRRGGIQPLVPTPSPTPSPATPRAAPVVRRRGPRRRPATAAVPSRDGATADGSSHTKRGEQSFQPDRRGAISFTSAQNPDCPGVGSAPRAQHHLSPKFPHLLRAFVLGLGLPPLSLFPSGNRKTNLTCPRSTLPTQRLIPYNLINVMHHNQRQLFYFFGQGRGDQRKEPLLGGASQAAVTMSSPPPLPKIIQQLVSSPNFFHGVFSPDPRLARARVLPSQPTRLSCARVRQLMTNTALHFYSFQGTTGHTPTFGFRRCRPCSCLRAARRAPRISRR